MTPCQKLLKQEGTARRIESMQQSSTTPSLHLWFLGAMEDCCMFSILLFLILFTLVPVGTGLLCTLTHLLDLCESPAKPVVV